jgi:hypothetical protein
VDTVAADAASTGGTLREAALDLARRNSDAVLARVGMTG